MPETDTPTRCLLTLSDNHSDDGCRGGFDVRRRCCGPTAATSAFITDITRRARYGAAHGVFGTIYDIGDALGPIAWGVLVAGLGYAHMFQAMAVLAIVMAIVFAVGTTRQPSRA
jgi:MFS family permease